VNDPPSWSRGASYHSSKIPLVEDNALSTALIIRIGELTEEQEQSMDEAEEPVEVINMDEA